MTSFWIAALKASPLATLATFFSYNIFAMSLRETVIESIGPDKAFHLTVLVVVLTFIISMALITPLLKSKRGNTVIVSSSSVSGDIIGGNKKSL